MTRADDAIVLVQCCVTSPLSSNQRVVAQEDTRSPAGRSPASCDQPELDQVGYRKPNVTRFGTNLVRHALDAERPREAVNIEPAIPRTDRSQQRQLEAG